MGAILSFFAAVLGFYERPTVHFPKEPITFSAKTSSGTKEVENTNLTDFVETRCRSLYRKFKPAWWLANHHLQTAYCVIGDFTKVDKVEYDRVLIQTLDGGTIGLDFTPPAEVRELDDDTPIIVCTHGLTGGSYEAYVRSILAPAVTPVTEGGLGYRGVVVNFRGCAGVPITSPQLYSAGHTDDLRVAILYLAKRYPRARLLGIGFSLGANVMTRYIGEEGEHCRLITGCALACPWDLLKNHYRLAGHWFNHMVYDKAMGFNLQELVRRHKDSLAKFPEHAVAKAIPATLALKSPALHDFDNAMTRIAGGSPPTFPLASAQAYYEWASSHHHLPQIHVPFLAISAADDPIVAEIPEDLTGNGNVVFTVTPGGGHLGWFEAGPKLGEVRRWVTQPVLEWLKAFGDDMLPERRDIRPLHEVDGFIKEVGRDEIGCKEIPGGGRVIGIEDDPSLIKSL